MNDSMTITPTDTIAFVRRYLDAIERRVPVEELARFFHPDVVQEELPNRLVPNGARRSLGEIIEAARRGRTVMAGERYALLNIVGSGEIVMFEALWSGTLAVPLGTLAAGDVMRAHIASVIEFAQGAIIAQRSYDCFEPW